jgi:magnesium-transporting ATPase (P-type)
VLTDDSFASIAAAVGEGRTIFDNIKKALVVILPTNGGEAGVILLAVFLGTALPAIRPPATRWRSGWPRCCWRCRWPSPT